MATDAISVEQALKQYAAVEDDALMKGASFEEVNAIRSRIGLPAGEISTSSSNPSTKESTMAEAAVKPINPITAQAQKASAAVSAPTTTPKVSDSLLAVQAQIATNTARAAANLEAMQADKKRTDVAVGSIQKNIANITSSLQTVQRVKDNANLEAQNTAIEALDLAGGSENQKALMEMLGKQQKESRGYLDELSNKMAEEHTGIQIVDSIVNTFSTIQLQTQLSFSEQKEANLQADIANISNATESINKAQLLTRKLVNDDTIAANYAMLGAEGNIKAAEAEIANIKTNAQGIASLMAADNQLLSIKMALLNTENQAEEMDFNREKMDFAREQYALALEKHPIEMKAAKINLEASELALSTSKATNTTDRLRIEANNLATKKRFDDAVANEKVLVDTIRRAQVAGGLPVDQDDETIVLGYSASPGTPLYKKYALLLDMGINAKSGALGTDPADILNKLEVLSPSGSIESTPVSEALEDARRVQSQGYREDPNSVPKTEDDLKVDTNNSIKAHLKVKSDDIKTGDTSNPFHAPPMAVLKEVSAVANSPLYKNVLSAMDMQEMNHQKFVDSTVDGLMAKRITLEQATDGIVTTFTAAGVHNSEFMGGFKRFALPNQTTYNTTIQSPPTAFQELKSEAGIFLTSPLRALGIATTALGVTGGSSREQVQKSLDKARGRYETLNLMDRAKVMNLLVRLVSARNSQKPATPVDNNNQ